MCVCGRSRLRFRRLEEELQTTCRANGDDLQSERRRFADDDCGRLQRYCSRLQTTCGRTADDLQSELQTICRANGDDLQMTRERQRKIAICGRSQTEIELRKTTTTRLKSQTEIEIADDDDDRRSSLIAILCRLKSQTTTTIFVNRDFVQTTRFAGLRKTTRFAELRKTTRFAEDDANCRRRLKTTCRRRVCERSRFAEDCDF
ncbi:hypothetical protein ZOSMA_33G01170 [Zostera marina]|uniref:Uncharacterized protein n=1 Tax=Zostera marina TaxID=29655 RepID=A0A0K9P7V7_ZOSMR|nr:hypothetical protein ZOSMA_33G01170 [Zostera marina]